MLTRDQQTKLVQAAKQRNPNITLQETKDLLNRANSLGTNQNTSSSQDLTSQLQDTVESIQGKNFSSSNQNQGVIEKLARLFANTTINNVNTIGNFAGASGEITKTNQSMDELFKQSQALTNQAKTETDPTKKAALLQQARDLMNQNSNQANSLQSELNQKQQASGITDKDMERGNTQFAIRRGLGQSAELGALLLPGAKELQAAKGASIGAKAISGAVQGLMAGELQGLASASENAVTIKEALTDIVKNAGIGVVTGGVLGGVTAKIGEKLGAGKLAKNMLDETGNLKSTDKILESTIGGGKKTQQKVQKTALEFLNQNNITVPAKRAAKIKPVEVAKELLADGFGEVKDPMELRKVTNSLTGDSGLITGITRNSVADLKGEIQLLDDIGSKGKVNPVLQAVDDQLKISHDIPKDIRPDINLEISDMLSSAQGSLPDTYDPAKLYDIQRSLEKKAVAADSKSTYLTKNPSAEAQADVYRAAADEIRSKIELMAKEQDVVSKNITQEIINKAEKISPRIAEKLKQAAKNGKISDVRHIASPYAKTNEMLDLTDANLLTSFTKMGNKFQNISGQIGGAIGGTPGRLLGTGVDIASKGSVGKKISNASGSLYDTLQSVINKSPVTKSSAVNNLVINKLSQLLGENR